MAADKIVEVLNVMKLNIGKVSLYNIVLAAQDMIVSGTNLMNVCNLFDKINNTTV